MRDAPEIEIVPEVGDVVHWHPDGQLNISMAGIVSAHGAGSLCLNIVDPANFALVVRDGVRHKDDAHVTETQKLSSGLWSWRPQELARRRLLASLAQKVEELLLEQATKPGKGK